MLGEYDKNYISELTYWIYYNNKKLPLTCPYLKKQTKKTTNITLLIIRTEDTELTLTEHSDNICRMSAININRDKAYLENYLS